jgi:hypothetical protein
MRKAEAIRRLAIRWNEQVELFPGMIRTESALAFLHQPPGGAGMMTPRQPAATTARVRKCTVHHM